MAIIKLLHVTCVFIWVGNLLMLSRFMGYQVKEEPAVQMRLAAIYQRIYYFVGLPTMCLSMLFGFILLSGVDLSYRPGWLHMKITFILLMFLLDMWCGRLVSQLNEKPDTGRGAKYKAFHGIAGLALIGILCSVYVVRDREGEFLHQQEKQIALQALRESRQVEV